MFLRAFVISGCIVNLMITPVKSAYTATYTVNSLSDPGDGVCNKSNCTLREAINAANGTATSDLIQFSLSGTITLGSSLPGILSAGGALTIDGAGRNVIVSGADSNRHFFIDTGANLTLKNLELKNGYSGDIGGGIYNKGTLEVENSTITSNRTENDGGGIYSEGTLTLDNVSVTDNTTDVSDGGGLYIESGEAHIIDCNFQGNTATYSGGAIYNDGDLEVINTIFFLNNAFGGNGGAIFTESGFQIHQSTFLMNSAEGDGGAIAINLASGSIYRSVFYYNITTLDDGGGVFINNNYSSSPVGIYDCRFELNDANSDGGGFYLVRGPLYILRSLFDDNHADGDGGGGYNLDGYVNIYSSTFYDNRADHGGGLYITPSISSNIYNSTISSNSTTLIGGGGGVYAGSPTYVYNSIITNNSTGGNCDDTWSHPTNMGNNIDSGTTCNWGSDKGSMSNTNPLLGALEDNGGFTKTMALLNGSPAINGVIYNAPNNCPDEDQRSFPRPFSTYCDIGAVEQYYRILLPIVIRN